MDASGKLVDMEAKIKFNNPYFSDEEIELSAYRYNARLRLQGLIYNDNLIIKNPDFKHTRILLALFLECAEKSIDIFCNQLSPEVYDDKTVISILERVKDKIKIRIVTEKKLVRGDREFLKYIPEENVRHYPQESVLDQKKIPHIWIMDHRAYRDELNRVTREGEVYTNDPKGALERTETFKNIFNKARSSCTRYSCSFCQ